MKRQIQLNGYMVGVLTLGFTCLAAAAISLPLYRFDFQLLVLTAFTIGFGSRITVQIPTLKSHISVSDTFIFLALLLYGGEVAVVLAAIEAFCSSWRFCTKKLTVFLNAAMVALSTSIVAVTLKLFALSVHNESHDIAANNWNDMVLLLLVMALTQFVANTMLASVYAAFKSEKPIWETWKTKYIWTFITYFFGAAVAGISFELNHHIGFSVTIAAFPVIYFIYQSYKMYLQNVEMSIAQAQQAEKYAETLEKQSLALRESEERFRSAFNYAPIGIALLAPTGAWLKVNRALCSILGYAEEEFLGTDFQSMIFPEDLGTALVKIHELLSGVIPNCRMEQRYIHKSGKIVWTSWSVSTANETALERPNLIFQIQDITDKKSAEEKLQHDATHDALTGLPNRAHFMQRLEEAMKKSQINPLYKVSLLFIDLDRFKVVNDSLGHAVGDQLLTGIADRLRDCLRPNDLVARLGGDEFTILVEGRHSADEVVKIAERIQKKFSVPFNLDENEIYSSASIGILHASEKHQKPADLMRDADTAMYQAKRAGKARHEVFDEKMHSAVKEILQLETDLRRAIEKEEFTVYYQPIYSLATNEIEGFEALARWQHENLGSISPDKFIPLAEEIGVIDALGEQIFRKACRQISLLENPATRIPYTLNVNVSCKQFAQPTLVNKIKRILTETEFSPHRLKIEITETVFLEHRDTAIEMLKQLCELGIEINIDDFGTGYSNLSYLTRLPVSTLKIDRSFISPSDGEENNMEVVQTIVMLARSLGMKVIAEGVENAEQLEQLKKLNCEGAQGFYFAAPMTFDDLKRFLEDKRETVTTEKFANLPIISTVQ